MKELVKIFTKASSEGSAGFGAGKGKLGFVGRCNVERRSKEGRGRYATFA